MEYYDKVCRDRKGILLYPNDNVYFVCPVNYTLEKGIIVKEIESKSMCIIWCNDSEESLAVVCSNIIKV